jgi:hypothetical protein
MKTFESTSVLVVLLFFAAPSARVLAQQTSDASELKKGIPSSFGYHVSQYQHDFGFGIQYSSPTIFNDQFLLRARTNIMFLQRQFKGETVWSPYSTSTIGTAYITRSINNILRLYSEGGIAIIFTPRAAVSKNVIFGGYGLFGFEFSASKKLGYLIEIGGIGSGAKADKDAGQPIFSNGLIINSGIRYYIH